MSTRCICHIYRGEGSVLLISYLNIFRIRVARPKAIRARIIGRWICFKSPEAKKSRAGAKSHNVHLFLFPNPKDWRSRVVKNIYAKGIPTKDFNSAFPTPSVLSYCGENLSYQEPKYLAVK